MKISYGSGISEYGPGIDIILTGEEVALAIEAFILTHNVWIEGSRTIKVNGELCEKGYVYIDPSGSLFHKGKEYSGQGIRGK